MASGVGMKPCEPEVIVDEFGDLGGDVEGLEEGG